MEIPKSYILSTLIYGLLNEAVGSSDCIVSSDTLINELEIME